jgi:hypothetical protein
MAELETRLQQLAGEVEWPSTPPLRLHLHSQARTERGRGRSVWVALAAILIALAVAFSVPPARSAILRAFHLGGVTVERVDVLPPAQERPLGADLGPLVDAEQANRALGTRIRLPSLSGSPRLHLRAGVVSLLLATPRPVLLSEFRSSGFVLKKIAATATHVESVTVGSASGLWIAGAQHVVVLPATPARLAGNVLVWQQGMILYRLEGRDLSKQAALELAAKIMGT